MAASLLVGLLVWRLWPNARQRGEPAAPKQASVNKQTGTVERRGPVDTGFNRKASQPDGPGEGTAAAVRPRAANAYQQLVLYAVERRARSFIARRDPAELDRVVAMLQSDPAADVQVLAESLMKDRDYYERELLNRILQSEGQRQQVQLRLLGHLGSGRAVPFLIQLSRSGPNRAETIRVLTRLADPITLGELAYREPDARLRQVLLKELLSRGRPQAVEVYLNFVRAPETRASALAALDSADPPPVDLLFEFLQGPDYARRLAAAVALGHLDGPEITERLIELVTGNVHRQEALAALLSSPGEKAAQFIGQARQSRSLGGSVDSVHLQLRILFP